MKMSLPLFYFVSLLVLLTGEVILPITSAGSPYSDTVALSDHVAMNESKMHHTSSSRENEGCSVKAPYTKL